MSYLVFASKQTEHLIQLLDNFKKIVIMHYPRDTRDVNYIYISHIRSKTSMKYLPTTWDDFNQYASTGKVAFSGLDPFPVVYLHNFEYPGVKEWSYIQSKLIGKIVIMTYDPKCEFTPFFIDDGLERKEFELLTPHQLNKNKFKEIKLKHIIKEGRFPFNV